MSKKELREKIKKMTNELVGLTAANDPSCRPSFSEASFNEAIIELAVGISHVREGEKRTKFWIGTGPSALETSAMQQAINAKELYRLKYPQSGFNGAALASSMPAENNEDAKAAITEAEIAKVIKKKKAGELLFGIGGYKYKCLQMPEIDELIKIGEGLRRFKVIYISIITASAVVATAAGVGLYYLLRDNDKPAELDDGDYDIPEIEPTSGTAGDDPFQPTDGTD